MSSTTNYKHFLNNIISSFFREYRSSPLRILETHQGEGLSTKIYQKYGLVCAFEKDTSTYIKMCNNFPALIFLDKVSNIEEALSLVNKECVFTYSKATDSRDAIKVLQNNHIKFDIIDVDPYGLPLPFFPTVFYLLKNLSILFVTTGEMHFRYNFELIFSEYNLKDSEISTIRSYFFNDLGSFLSAKLIHDALKLEIGLSPIFFHNYYSYNQGVHRLCYIVKENLNYKEKYDLKKSIYLHPIINLPCVRYTTDSKNIEFPWKFTPDVDEKTVIEGIKRRFEKKLTKTLN
jgi:hypothetical protein